MIFSFRSAVCALTLGLFAAHAVAAETHNPESAVSTVLLQTEKSWDGAQYKPYSAGQPQLTVLKIVIPAHTALPWHTHPMPNAAYVVSGTLNVESQDGHSKKTLHAGDVLPEMVDRVHRGWTGKSPVELIVFYAGVAGMPTAIKTQ